MPIRQNDDNMTNAKYIKTGTDIELGLELQRSIKLTRITTKQPHYRPAVMQSLQTTLYPHLSI